MNMKIINNCAGTDPGLPTAGTDPDRRNISIKLIPIRKFSIATYDITTMKNSFRLSNSNNVQDRFKIYYAATIIIIYAFSIISTV